MSRYGNIRNAMQQGKQHGNPEKQVCVLYHHGRSLFINQCARSIPLYHDKASLYLNGKENGKNNSEGFDKLHKIVLINVYELSQISPIQ